MIIMAGTYLSLIISTTRKCVHQNHTFGMRILPCSTVQIYRGKMWSEGRVNYECNPPKTVRRQHPQAHIHHQAKAVNIGTQHWNATTTKKPPNTRVVHRMYIFPAFPPIMWLVWVIRSVQRLTWSHSWLLLSSSPWKKYCRVTSAFLWGVKWRPGSVLPWSSLDVSAALFSCKCVCVCVQWLWWPIQSKENRQQGCTRWDMLAKQTLGPHAQESPTVRLRVERWQTSTPVVLFSF